MLRIISIFFIQAVLINTLQANDIIKGSGASFPYTIYQKWIKIYNKETGIKIDFIKKGSSKGIKDMKARAVDFAGTDKPLSPKTLKKNNLCQFPSIVSAVVMGYNLPNITEFQLSRSAIVAIASGEIQYWDDILITKSNKNLKMPHKKITFIHRADGSGTTYNFTYYLSKVSKKWRKAYGAKKSLHWPGTQHIGGKSNSGVAGLLKQTPYSIGYIDYADAKNSNIAMASLENLEGNFIQPTLKSFQIATIESTLDSRKDFYAIIVDPKGKKSYPIVAATFILLPLEKIKTDKQITQFYNWCFTKGQTSAQKLGFVPLPHELVVKIKAYWDVKGLL